MTVNDIVRETLTTLKSSHQQMTPDNYMNAFCKIAKRKGMDLADCKKNDKYIEKLNPFLKDEISKYSIKEIDDLVTYLIATLNRFTGQEKNRQNIVLVSLVKELLSTIKKLHNREASELCSASLQRIEYLSDQNSFEILKEKWEKFSFSYSDDFLEPIKTYAKIDKKDLKKTISEIEKALIHESDNNTIDNMASMVVASLTPSLTSTMDDDIATLSYELKNAPKLINDKSVQQRIHKMVENRINVDKQEVKKRVLSLDELLGNVSKRLVNFIDTSNLSKERITKIKSELANFDHSKHSFETIQNRLIKIAESLEIETDSLNTKMQKDDEIVKTMQLKIKSLEEALNIAKKESKKDFLTSLVSKRGLDEELNRVHKSYIRYEIEYSLAFFDIDFFKKVNDTYGHEAGDLVLKKIGELFKIIKRDVDVVGRYGGEEFLAILPNTPLDGALIFSEKVRKLVEETEFLYKGDEIPVTISVGVSHCEGFSEQKDMIADADSQLYNAKKSGRNQVFPKNR
jgi:diguanylate cyclase (GGDEF)-like protein